MKAQIRKPYEGREDLTEITDVDVEGELTDKIEQMQKDIEDLKNRIRVLNGSIRY